MSILVVIYPNNHSKHCRQHFQNKQQQMCFTENYTVLILGLDLTVNPMILQVFRYKIAALKESQIEELHYIAFYSYLTECFIPKKGLFRKGIVMLAALVSLLKNDLIQFMWRFSCWERKCNDTDEGGCMPGAFMENEDDNSSPEIWTFSVCAYTLCHMRTRGLRTLKPKGPILVASREFCFLLVPFCRRRDFMWIFCPKAKIGERCRDGWPSGTFPLLHS